ncbi:MAG: hypothetical protein KJN99_01690 [Marinicaulis sp.]|nr:hypothetical protein [Marinicaulis sp.]
MTNDELWRGLTAVDFDEIDVLFPFSKRLARDNGWSHQFAVRVVEEYRRFANQYDSTLASYEAAFGE